MTYQSSSLFILRILLLTLPLAAAEPTTSSFDDLDWPQTFDTSDGLEVAIHQPQVHEWNDYREILLRSAVAVKPKGGDEKEITYGALTVEAATTVDKDERVVFLGYRKITELDFPNAKDEATAERYKKAVNSIMSPTRPIAINLDRVLANAERNQRQNNPQGISVDPPPIFYSTDPAILVIFLGPPKFEAIEGSDLFFGANTNWDILLDPVSTNYFLLADDVWLTTQDVMSGPWTVTTDVPAAAASLPSTEDWKDIRAALPAKAGNAPKVFVSDRPAELILTDGKPAIAPISGTKIFYLANSESDIFLYGGDYFLLSAGRWFTAIEPKGPWTSAMDAIPEEFSKIPEEHPKAHVLASVPGTADAEEALIMAQVPQTATVQRADAKLEVKYEGDPKFVAIKGTEVQYAINTPNDVFKVDPMFYCCHQGVWFQATASSGPWTVCDTVPDAIYNIPASSPKHNVTYVTVYDSTPTTVTTGYTAGYSGCYVFGDLLLFGAGLWIASEILDDWDDHWHHCHWHYHACHWSYGCGARYDWYHGGYYRAGYRAYGPYGGAGYGAVYNPWTGGYARAGRVYGPRGTAYAREGYNPWTDTYGARVGASTPYGSWGRSVVARDDEWIRSGYRSDARGTVRGIQNSDGDAALRVNRRYGDDSFLGKKDGDMYVGRDGNLYRRDDEGDWAKLNRDGWNDIERPNPVRPDGPSTDRPGTRPAVPSDRRPTTQIQPDRPNTRPNNPTRPSTQPARPTSPSRPSTQPARPSVQPRTTPSQLQRDYSARQRGNARTMKSRSRMSSSRSGGRSRGR